MRMLGFGSSLLDLAVFREAQAGRRVVMDFNRNPAPVPGDASFSLDRLDADVAAHLRSAGAARGLPGPPRPPARCTGGRWRWHPRPC